MSRFVSCGRPLSPIPPRWNAPTLRTTRNESPLVMMVLAALEGGA